MPREGLPDALWNTLDASRGTVRTRILKYLLALILLRFLEGRAGTRLEELRSPQSYRPDLDIRINEVASKLAQTYPALRDIFDQIDFTNTDDLGESTARNTWICRVLRHLDEIGGDRTQPRDLFQEMLDRRLERPGQNATSMHTPRSLREMIVRIAAPQAGERICDPFCGSGSLLVRAAKESATDRPIIGQDINTEARVICLMNLVINGFSDIRIKRGNAIEDPILADDGKLLLFDLIVTDPPLGRGRWGRSKIIEDPWGRFRWGIPPRTQWGWAAASHIISTLHERGRAVVTAPLGLLFRGGPEARIRQSVIEDNLVDGVIMLPRRSFRRTSGAIVLLVFNKSKCNDSIFFIDGRRIADEGNDPNRSRNIDRVISIWKERKENNAFSRLAPLDQVAAENYSLDVARYLPSVSLNEAVDLSVTRRELKTVETELRRTWAELTAALGETLDD